MSTSVERSGSWTHGLHREDVDAGPLVIPAPITAEIDYLLGQRFGGSARRPSWPTSPQGVSWSRIWSRRTTRRSWTWRIDVQVFSGGRVTVRASTINGNVQLDENRGKQLVVNNTVDGDIQLFQNRKGVKRIKRNRVDGNLQCKSNRPRPVGGQNVVNGDKEGQCSRL